MDVPWHDPMMGVFDFQGAIHHWRTFAKPVCNCNYGAAEIAYGSKIISLSFHL